ncbi:MAG: hypothetical protein NZ580_03140 [Bacteroidia bacterium]|nr:hypothetical protein [Bacteroidia bacterium]MDW8235327.1 hypothetical protein [Bacteroidia bacterium]
MGEAVRNLLLWSSVWGVAFAQLPSRYALKANLISFFWREYELTGEYRLFAWAPAFQANVERARWEGLASIVGVGFYPRRTWLLRGGIRYYFLRPKYALEGLWGGLHGIIGWRERKYSGGMGLSVGYQHIFRQGYGFSVEPFLRGEGVYAGEKIQFALHLGLNIGVAARRWLRRNIP